MSATLIQKKKMMESELGSGTPSIHYIGISIGTILPDGTGVIEPSTVNGYSRIAVENNKDNWTDCVDGEISNKIALQFPIVKNTSWNTIEQPLYLFIATSETGIGDDIIYYNELLGDKKKVFQLNSLPKFQIGMLKVKM